MLEELFQDGGILGFLRRQKYGIPSQKAFGFIGLGTMGKNIVNILLESAHDITIWNRTASKADIFVDMGARKVEHPEDLILDCDITFCCVSDAEASKAVFFGEHGILRGLERAQHLGRKNKGYIELTTIDPVTSMMICQEVLMKGGMYLEAPFFGTSSDALAGRLIIVAAGNKELYEDCRSCFRAITQHVSWVHCQAGNAMKLKLVFSMVQATACAALGEAMALVENLNMDQDDFLQYLRHGPLSTANELRQNAQKMNELSFEKETALKTAQKDISLSLSMADEFSHSIPVAAAANEVYEQAKRLNFSDEDMSAVYKVLQY